MELALPAGGALKAPHGLTVWTPLKSNRGHGLMNRPNGPTAETKGHGSHTIGIQSGRAGVLGRRRLVGLTWALTLCYLAGSKKGASVESL